MNKTRYERVSSLPRDLLSESDSASKRSFNFGGNGGDFISQRQLCPSISGIAQVNLINLSSTIYFLRGQWVFVFFLILESRRMFSKWQAQAGHLLVCFSRYALRDHFL